MKKLYLLFSLLILSVFASAQDLKSFIPTSASFIVHIDGKRINSEVNFDSIRNSDMYKDFIFKMLNNKSAEDRAISKLFETPDETGLNIKSDMYFYSIPYDNNIVTVVSMRILNSSKFSSFLKDLFNKNKNAKVNKAGKKNFYLYDNSTLIFWNSENVFYCNLPYSYNNQKGYSKSYLLKTIKTIGSPLLTNNVLTDPKLAKAFSKASDITYAFNTNSLTHTPWLYQSINKLDFMKDTSLINEDLFKDTYSYSYLNFENGKIVLDGEQFYGSKLASIINPIFNMKPSTDLANLLFQTPVTSYLSYAFSLTETKNFLDKTFKYNSDSILILYIKESQSSRFNGDPMIMSYQNEIDTINYLINGPENPETESKIKVITDSGTVYNKEQESNESDYYYEGENKKYEHATLNWFQVDSLEKRRDTLYEMITSYKDTLAFKSYKESGIKADELWYIFKGECLFLFHAMISVERKYKTFEMDEEYNYVEVEKTKTIPMPLYSLAATINNDSLFQKYLNMLILKGIIQKEKDRYLVVLGDMNQYLWVQGSVCVLTNDNNFSPAKRANDNKSTRSDFETTNYNRVISNQSGAFIEVGKILASSAHFVDDKQSAEMLEIMATYFDEMISFTDFKSDSDYISETQILFNDTHKNSFNSLYDMINELYVHFTKK